MISRHPKAVEHGSMLNRAAIAALLILASTCANAAPGDVLYSDNFEGGMLWTTTVANFSGVNNFTANSPSNSLYTRGGVVETTSPGTNLSSVPAIRIDVWVRRGSDAFSENPETGEDLEFGYVDSGGNFVVLETFPGGGAQGEVFTRSYDVFSANALYNNFRVRVRQTGGSGGPPANGGIGWDYWHIDDVSVTEIAVPTVPAPRADWRFDELSWNGTPGEITDTSGNGYTGTASNASTVSGVICNAADLSATGSTDYLSMDYRALNGLTDFTISAWGKTGSMGTYAALISAAKGNTGLDSNELILLFNGASSFEPLISEAFFGTQTNIPLPAPITDDAWHHYVWTRVAATRTSCFYVDGVLQGCVQNIDPVNDVLPITVVNGGLIIGQEQDSVGGGFDANQAWRGLLDEFLVFNQALSAAQVGLLYNNQAAGKNYDGSARTCPQIQPLINYHMDEPAGTWTAPGTVTDSSGNGNNGNPLGGVDSANISPARAGSPGTCGYGTIPDNTSNNVDGVDTGFTPGNQGSITFWYNSNENWTGGGTSDRLLFDASRNLGNNNADKSFFLIRRNNGGGNLRFVVEDTNDTALQVNINGLGYAANSWHHIAVTWDLPNDFMEVYVDGVSAGTDNTNTNGNIGNIQTLYIGDNRDTNTGGGGWNNASLNGLIDEFKVYDTVITPSQVLNDYNATHPCQSLDHFNISYVSGSAGSTCSASEIQISARDILDNLLTGYNGTVNLTTSTSHGDWSNLDELGNPSSDPPANAVVNGSADDGGASYTFSPGAGADNGSIALFLSDQHAEGLTVSVVDPLVPASMSTTTVPLVFSDNAFVIAPTTCTGSSCPLGSNEVVAGRDHTFSINMVRRDPSTGDCGVATGYNAAATALKAWIVRDTDDPGGTLPALAEGTAALGDGAAPGSNNLQLNFAGAPGTSAFALQSSDAGKYVINIRDDSGSFATGPINGSTGTLTVRPFGLAFSNINAGGTPNPGAATPAGTRFTTAGSPFAATLGAYLYAPGDDMADGNGVPDSGAVLTDNGLVPSFAWDTSIIRVLNTPSAAQGGVAGNFSFNGGANIINAGDYAGGMKALGDFKYFEVGSIRLEAQLSNYLNSGINMNAANGLSPQSGVVGRFGADRFTISSNNPVLGSGCGSFTYVDQGFSYTTAPQLTVTARAADGTTALSNYEDFTGSGGDNWWLLDFRPSTSGGGVTMNYTDLAPTPADMDFNSSLADYSPNSGATGSNGSQLFNLSGTFAYTDRNAAPMGAQGPFNGDFRVDFSVTDSDGASGSYSLATAASATPDKLITFANPQQRYGRLYIGTGIGSELLPVAVPFETQYYNGTAFVRNTQDSCTVINDVAGDGAPDLSLSNNVEASAQTDGDILICTGVTSTMTLGSNPLAAGDGQLSFSAPGAGCVGYANIGVDLGTAAPPGQNLPWLQFDWNGDGVYDNDPAGRVDFGIRGGSDEVIYRREPWK